MTGYEKQASQLKAWARSIARLHSLELLNFTTSFVDGEVFPRIVDDYIPHIPSIRSSTCTTADSVGSRLGIFGCITSFYE